LRADWLQEQALPAAVPNWHFRHIVDEVVAALKKWGVTENQIHTMLVDNPRTIFSSGPE